MAYKEVQRVDISESGPPLAGGRQPTADSLRDGTVPGNRRKYIALAEGMGVSREGPGPTEDRLAPWADQIYQWLTGGRLQLTRVQELLAQRGCPGLPRLVARISG